MILSSFFALSILFDVVKMPLLSERFNQALLKNEIKIDRVVSASETPVSLPKLISRPQINKNSDIPVIYADRYILADSDSGVIFLKNNAGLRVPIASTTKIMTAVVALENYSPNEIVTVNELAAFQPGADSYLRVGEKITVSELLNCLMIKSGNDAAYALALHMDSEGKDTSEFIEKMNKKARDLNMKDTIYNDPAGLDTSGYSSAYDLYLLTRYVLKKPEIIEITKKVEYTAKSVDGEYYHYLNNSNRLVGEYQYLGALGIKTGYMPEAGHCLVAAVVRNNHTLISVVLKTSADTASASADESRKILDWGFSNIIW